MLTGISFQKLGLILALPIALLGQPSSSQAERAAVPDAGMVTAESQFGNGTVQGQVRTGRNGLEVRLPRGTWVECANSCSETLRLETVDFWEAQNRTTNRCGLLGCLRLRYPNH